MDTINIVKLREQSGAGILDCREALEEAKGDFEKALEVLRKRGQKIAAKRQDKTMGEGLIHAYIHSNGKVGALLEMGCETDFVARNPEFQNLVHEIAMHIAAADPMYLKQEDVPQEVLEKEKDIYRAEIKGQVKEAFLEKALEGKLKKYYQEVCLLKQIFIKDDKLTVEDLINQKIAALGEKIEIKRFTRYQI